MNGWTKNEEASFFFGAGLMGIFAGLGFGSTASNKWALLLGAGSLFYANSLYPVVDVAPRQELTDVYESAKARARQSLPFTVSEDAWL